MRKVLIALALVMVISLACFAQATKVYQIAFNTSPITDVVAGYSIYLEQRAMNSGFVLVDGMDYSATIDAFYITDIANTGQTGEIVYEITLPLDGKWSVAGVIAYAADGLKSPVGASTSVKIAKRPGKPTGVVIRPKP